MNMPRTHMKKKKVSSTSDSGEIGYRTCKTMKLDQYLLPCIKANSKWIKDLTDRINHRQYTT